MELLKTLIALGGRDVREEQLADILWPHTEGDIAHRDLATTLHRLRKLIQNDKAITLRGGRLALEPHYCWVDAWAFEQLLGKAEISHSPQLIEQALGLYKGHFLENDTEPYIISLRERLRSKFVRYVGEMGRHLERSGEWEKAGDWYSEGLKAESLAEELYRRLMLCYQQLGRRAEAVEVYHRCRKTLSMVLGIRPSAQTEAVYESLMEASPHRDLPS